MKLYLVTPLSSGLPFDSLSYFSDADIALGSLVSVTVKKRKIPGVIISASSVENEKMAIKNASFAIKKIRDEDRRDFIDPEIISSLSKASQISLVYLPNLLRNLIPEKLLDEKRNFFIHANKKEKRSEIHVLSLPKSDRITRYKSLIRESFAKRESIILFFPTIHELEKSCEELSKGIEDFSVKIHSKTSVKYEKECDAKLAGEHSLLILSTPSLHPFVRDDIGHIVVENEISHHYINQGGIDMRTIFTSLAKDLSLPLLFGSTLLSLERYELFKRGEAVDLMPLYMRSDDCFTLIKMDEEKRGNSPYLSVEVLRELEKMKQEGRGHYFIYTQRKGMYPTTVCADCSTLLTCETCDKPLVLHTIGSKKAYMCHYCETLTHITEENPVYCRKCHGWRMRMLGIASSGLEALLRESGIPVFVIDGERTKTKKELESALSKWQKEPFSILIGTELALNAIDSCDGSVIASLDSLFSLPEYSIDERVVALLVDMKEKTKGTVYLQTRMSKNPLFAHLTDYSFHHFYTWSLDERKTLHLPPFFSVIKCTFTSLHQDEKEHIQKVLTDIKKEHAFFEIGGQKLLLFIHIKQEDWLQNEEERLTIKELCLNGKLEYNPQTFFS